MKEIIIGKIDNVEGKSSNSILIKTCSLIFTNKRIVVKFTGKSNLTQGLIGNLIGGTMVGINFVKNNKKNIKNNIEKDKKLSLNELINKKENFEILKNNIINIKFHHGFLNKIMNMNDLIIKTKQKKYYFKVNNENITLTTELITMFNS